MSRILIAGAGGAPTENVIRSLLEDDINEEIIGMGSEPFDLVGSAACRKYCVPYASKPEYRKRLFSILDREKPGLFHAQNDLEIRVISRMRSDILETGTKLYMPKIETVENCVDKGKSYEIWKNAGICVPKTMLVRNEADLGRAFEKLGNENGEIWLRATVGGGGRGALPTDNYSFAKLWIDRFRGWGEFTAAEKLSPETVTWLSIWYQGELVVAQTRKRVSWNFGNRTLSGVTGITRVGETASDEVVNRVAQQAILSVDAQPHGIFGVDMTYDDQGIPNPTEINVSRFFTTVYFFTRAGLNLPKIFKDIALYDRFPSLKQKINPLPDGLLWIRAMDREPLLTTYEQIKEQLG